MSKRRRLPDFRYLNEMVGAFVLLTLAVLLVALVQSARVQQWFDPGARLRVVLPQEGLFGLSAGAEVQVLGTLAGSVRQIDIDPQSGRIVADVRIRREFTSFIRTDSAAKIRRKLAVAGDAYLDITRGQAHPLDWDLAVIEATTDSGPTDAMNALLATLQDKLVPVLDHLDEAVVQVRDVGIQLNAPDSDFRQLLTRTSSIAGRIDNGEGTLGKLLTDDQLMQEVLETTATLRTTLDKLDPVLVKLKDSAGDIAAITQSVRTKSDKVPQIIEKTDQSLEQLQALLTELREATTKLPKIADNLVATTDATPALVVQAQQTLRKIEQLAEQLQQSWLIGGAKPAAPGSLSPTEAQR